MAKIKIKDLPMDMKISKEVMKSINGGFIALNYPVSIAINNKDMGSLAIANTDMGRFAIANTDMGRF